MATDTDALATLPTRDPLADATVIERRLYRVLDELGIPYEPQRPFGIYVVDAYLPTLGIALESDGCTWHFCPRCGYTDDLYQPGADQKHRYDARRDDVIHKRHGVHTLRIWGHDLETQDSADRIVRRVLAPFLTALNEGSAENG